MNVFDAIAMVKDADEMGQKLFDVVKAQAVRLIEQQKVDVVYVDNAVRLAIQGVLASYLAFMATRHKNVPDGEKTAQELRDKIEEFIQDLLTKYGAESQIVNIDRKNINIDPGNVNENQG